MSNNPFANLVDRVHNTLNKLGFAESVVRNISDGQITLFCPDADRNDRSMIQVAVRLIPGIKSVVVTTKANGTRKS
ncbi:MAG: hypothetical protein WBD20_08660 [Pirellulaceae bacterium]